MPKIVVRVIDAYVFRRTKNGIKFLLLKRAKTKIYEHLWQGVAGKIEKNESAIEAATRELMEETGFTPCKIFVADHVSKFYEANGDRINLFLFLVLRFKIVTLLFLKNIVTSNGLNLI